MPCIALSEAGLPLQSDYTIQDPQYSQILRLATRELHKYQIISPERVLKLRLFLYYYDHLPTDIPWIKIRDTLARATSENKLALISLDSNTWITTPSNLDSNGELTAEARHAFESKNDTYKRWLRATEVIGPDLEKMLRRDLGETKGLSVSKNKVLIQLADGTDLEIDIQILGPISAAVEVKNKFSDVFHAPSVYQSRATMNDDHKQIDRFFTSCSSMTITPVLCASLVDRSFYGYQIKHRGFFLRMLFQYLPALKPDQLAPYQTLAHDIRTNFRVGHVKMIERIPDRILNWFQSLPARANIKYGPPTHQRGADST